MCKTRWIQHIDAHTVFMELLPSIHSTFHEAMICPNIFPEFGTEWGWDGETVM